MGTTLNGPAAAVVESKHPTNEELGAFYAALNHEKSKWDGSTILAMEAPRKIIEHILGTRMTGFDAVHYFVYEGVKVFEQGKRAEGERIENLSSDDKTFGRKP